MVDDIDPALLDMQVFLRMTEPGPHVAFVESEDRFGKSVTVARWMNPNQYQPPNVQDGLWTLGPVARFSDLQYLHSMGSVILTGQHGQMGCDPFCETTYHGLFNGRLDIETQRAIVAREHTRQQNAALDRRLEKRRWPNGPGKAEGG